EELAAEGTPTPLTIGFTPVLANQLASPAFAREMETFFTQRLAACDEAPAALTASGDGALVPLVDFWRSRLSRLQALFRRIDADLVSAFRRFQEQGRLEIIGSAATHGYLPLLGRDESIRLQLAVGREEHRRLFGVAPVGCWLPECAYRPRGKWRGKKVRRGIEQYLATRGFATSSPMRISRTRAARSAPTARSLWARSGSTRSGTTPGLRRKVARGRRARPIGRIGCPVAVCARASRRWCATPAPPCRSGAGTRATWR